MLNQTWRLLRNCRNCVPHEVTARRHFSAFPRSFVIILSKNWYELHKFLVFAKKPTLLAMESLRSSPTSSQPYTDQCSVFTFSSLVALLALLTSILLKISSLSRFHNTPFCKFDFFPCNFSKIHFALKEIHTHGNISILASKDNILESGLNSGMQGTTVHWNKQLFFFFYSIRGFMKKQPRISNVHR